MALTQGQKLAELNSQQVSELQNLLLRAGFNPGPVDGIMGTNTKNAYWRFLSRQGVQTQGTIDVITKLTADLWNNEVPELWQGVSYGGEVSQQSTTGGQGAPIPAAPAPPAQNSTPVPAAPAQTVAASSTPTVAPMNDAAAEQFVREKYPYMAYLLDIPEVRNVLLANAQKGGDPSALQAALNSTQWWQTTQEAQRLWDAKYATDPASAKALWDQRTIAVENLANQMGVVMDPGGAQWVAGRILREGWSDDQLKRFLGQLVRNAGGASPGQITETAAQMKAVARSFLVNMSDKDATEYATRIAEGSATKDAVTSMLRSDAKNRFTWLAPQIDAGLTPADLFKANREAVAGMLEIDPETIDLNDPRWSAIASGINDKGTMRSMNFAEAQQWARQRAEWRYTNNANKSASDIGLSMLKGMGVVK